MTDSEKREPEGLVPFGIYDTSTGEFVLNGYGPPSDVAANVKEGQDVVWQQVKRGVQRVNLETGDVEVVRRSA